MRSRRSVICSRRTALLARRSSRLSLGPANDFRRARASEEVIGAGATGPLRRGGGATSRRGAALGGGCLRTTGRGLGGFSRLRGRLATGLVTGGVHIFLTTQQFHVRQVTSHRMFSGRRCGP